MGTCLHAFIEIAQVQRNDTKEKITEMPGRMHWWLLATYEFDKDYQLMRMLDQSNNVKDLWPDDICSKITENQLLEDFEVKKWCTAEDYIRLISYGDDDSKAFSPIAEALKVFLMKMQTDIDWVRATSRSGTSMSIRILFHRT